MNSFDQISDLMMKIGVWRATIDDMSIGAIKITIGSEQSKKKISNITNLLPASLTVKICVDKRIIKNRKKFDYELIIHPVKMPV